jgi:hypothetical protein
METGEEPAAIPRFGAAAVEHVSGKYIQCHLHISCMLCISRQRERSRHKMSTTSLSSQQKCSFAMKRRDKMLFMPNGLKLPCTAFRSTIPDHPADRQPNGRSLLCGEDNMLNAREQNPSSSRERDALREGRRVGVVDRGCTPAHVLLPSIAAALTAPSSALVAAKGCTDLRTTGARVDLSAASATVPDE